MAKAQAEQDTSLSLDTAAVNEPTKHELPTQQQSGEAKWMVATDELYVNGVRAHNVGDRVPAENVDRNGWSGQVRSA